MHNYCDRFWIKILLILVLIILCSLHCTWLVVWCEWVGLNVLVSPGEFAGEYWKLAFGCRVGIDVGDNVVGDAVIGLYIHTQKKIQTNTIRIRKAHQQIYILFYDLTELYGLLEWSCSWSSGVWSGDGKWTEVKSGNDPVLLPIGICIELSWDEG